MLEWSYHATFAAAALYLAVTLDADPFRPTSPAQQVLGWGSLAFSIALLVLGSLVRRRSAAALTAAIVLTAIAGVFRSLLDFSYSGIYLTVIFVIRMVPGVSAIRTLKP